MSRHTHSVQGAFASIKFILALLSAVLVGGPALHTAEPSKPKIIFILTDLGYGDIGVFYQNQRSAANARSLPPQMTPNLDARAARGIQSSFSTITKP